MPSEYASRTSDGRSRLQPCWAHTLRKQKNGPSEAKQLRNVWISRYAHNSGKMNCAPWNAHTSNPKRGGLTLPIISTFNRLSKPAAVGCESAPNTVDWLKNNANTISGNSSMFSPPSTLKLQVDGMYLNRIRIWEFNVL